MSIRGSTNSAPRRHRDLTLVVAGQAFTFRLQVEKLQLGKVPVRALSFSLAQLYEPDRSLNARNLIECYWALCKRSQLQGEPEHPHDRHTYLLARLLPRTLTNLAAKIVPDRTFGPTSSLLPAKARNSALRTIEDSLQRLPISLPDIVSFRDRTCDALAMPARTEAESAAYEEIASMLLDDAAKVMAGGDQEGAVRLIEQRWRDACNRWYKRRRWASEAVKAVMSIISYECRAALQECYADVWNELLSPGGPLLQEECWSGSEMAFHSLWHIIHKAKTDHPDRRFDLFHGHIFALHPATRLLLQTATGRRILGDFVNAMTSLPTLPRPLDLMAKVRDLPAFRMVLHAIEVAVFSYMASREELAQDAKHRSVKELKTATQTPTKPRIHTDPAS